MRTLCSDFRGFGRRGGGRSSYDSKPVRIIAAKSEWRKNRNGRTAFAVTAVPYTDRLESELAPPFFSLLATVWLIAVREGEEGPQC